MGNVNRGKPSRLTKSERRAAQQHAARYATRGASKAQQQTILRIEATTMSSHAITIPAPEPEPQGTGIPWERLFDRAGLTTRERQIIRARYLSDSGMTLTVVGQQQGISRERVRQIEALALAKLQAVVDTVPQERESA